MSSFSHTSSKILKVHNIIGKQDALDYHGTGRPGKIEVVSTKPCVSQKDLSLARTPGVAGSTAREGREMRHHCRMRSCAA